LESHRALSLLGIAGLAHAHGDGTFQFACLIPGHFDAGMVGTITVK
jgi:plastocyanin